ncbi:MAG: winged helix-turn-helix transcriptional regulator [Ruminococcus sp.]|nr:winged helix-turn-helix transcriptional regulator [Ruminococcus sp.]
MKKRYGKLPEQSQVPPENGMPQRVGGEVKMISNLMKRRLMQIRGADEESVTSSGGWILGYLEGNEGEDIFQRDLEDRFCLRRATVSKMLQLMEQKGLIERQSVKHDARLKKIVLTEKGRMANHETLAALQQSEREVTEGIPEEKLKVFFEVCVMIRKNLYRMEDNGV